MPAVATTARGRAGVGYRGEEPPREADVVSAHRPLRTEAAMKPYPPAHGPASTNARLDAPARRQFQGAAPHEPLFVERWGSETPLRSLAVAGSRRS
jgi:hypothetical protein